MKKTLIVIANMIAIMMIATIAHAQGYAQQGGTQVHHYYFAISAALTITVSAAFGAMAQSKAASAALEGIARNPEAAGKIMTPMIIALALIESLVIYALVIAFLLQGKIA